MALGARMTAFQETVHMSESDLGGSMNEASEGGAIGVARELSSAVQCALDGTGIGGHVRSEPSSTPGVVRLVGRVVSEDDRLKADQVARSVEDVVDVIDEIVLSGRERPADRSH